MLKRKDAMSKTIMMNEWWWRVYWIDITGKIFLEADQISYIIREFNHWMIFMQYSSSYRSYNYNVNEVNIYQSVTPKNIFPRWAWSFQSNVIPHPEHCLEMCSQQICCIFQYYGELVLAIYQQYEIISKIFSLSIFS